MKNDISEKSTINKVLVYSLIVSLGGFLAGFHTTVISGAIGALKLHYSLDSITVGWVVSSMLIGCAVGAMGTASIVGKFGRKNLLIITALLYGGSAVASAYPLSLEGLIIARMLGGVAVGMSTVLCPMYISEISLPSSRGRMVTIFQLGMVLGILGTYLSNSYIVGLGDDTWQVSDGWKYMFLVEVSPAIIFAILLIFIPNTPHWLVEKGLETKAQEILKRLRGSSYRKEEINELLQNIKDTQQASFGKVLTLFSSQNRLIIFCGLSLAVFSQITGINAILYYAPEIFKKMGGTSDTAFLQTVGIGLINLIFTLVAIWLIDKAGRKKLLLIGSGGMFFALLIVAYNFYIGHSESQLVFIAILAFIAFFAISWGPVTFVLISEIFPQSIRSKGISIAVLTLWLSVFVVSQLFPILLESIGPVYTFGVFALSSSLSFLFVWKLIPETKGRSFEEIEKNWKQSTSVVKEPLATTKS